jgi:opacity protein-like surface antigen
LPIHRHSMRLSTCLTALALSLLAAFTLSAQQSGDERQEFALTVGELSGGNPSLSAALTNASVVPLGLSLNAGFAVGGNYARKIKDVPWGSVYWEVDALGEPNRYVAGAPVTATHAIRSVYLTPGLKMVFTPKEALSPWIVAGTGLAYYNSSGTSIGGGPTIGGSANRITYAVDFGAGVDYALNKKYTLRGEVRGFYTGDPNFGVATPGGLFSFEIGFGVVWRSPK